MRKRPSSIFFLLLTLLVALASLLLGVGKSWRHWEAQQLLGSSARLDTLHLSLETYKRLSTTDLGNGVEEFRFKGHHYDIIQKAISRDQKQVLLIGRQDEEEDALIEAFVMQLSQDGKPMKMLMGFGFSLCFLQPLPQFEFHNSTTLQTLPCVWKDKPYVCWLSPASPPPQV